MVVVNFAQAQKVLKISHSPNMYTKWTMLYFCAYYNIHYVGGAEYIA